jgi:hypothetical protein
MSIVCRNIGTGLTFVACLPSAQGRVYQATQGPGQGIRTAVRAIQDPTNRKLPTARLYHQPSIAPPRDSGRDSSCTGWCRPLTLPWRSPESTRSSSTTTSAGASTAEQPLQQWRSLGATDWRASDGRSSSCCCPEQRQTPKRRLIFRRRICRQAPEGRRRSASFAKLSHLPECFCIVGGQVGDVSSGSACGL